MSVKTTVGNLTGSFCLLSSSGIIALLVSVDPKVRKVAMGVIGVYFIFCIIYMFLPTEKDKVNPIVEQVKTVSSSVGSFLTGSSSGS